LVSTCEGEVVTGGLSCLPFHGVLGRDRVEILVDDSGLGRLIADGQSCTDEVASAVAECFVQTGLLGL
jgi:hypothetical protein